MLTDESNDHFERVIKLAELERLFQENLERRQIDTLGDCKVPGELAQQLPIAKLQLSSLTLGDKSSVQKAERRDVQKFLNYVAAGQQNEAEAMLMKNPHLASATGDVVESNRSFQWITGFQYALWALDVHMWRMIQKYLSPENARAQGTESETGVWVEEHGVDASQLLDKLVSAYSATIDLYKQGKYEAGDAAWCRLGAIQGIIPAHVAQEFCHEKRSFSPTPDFSDLSERLTRSQNTDEGEWFSCSYSGGLLGKHAVFRGANKCAQAAGWARGVSQSTLEADCNSVRALKDMRVSQRLEFINALQPACRIKLPS
jgi:hypothetical protein